MTLQRCAVIHTSILASPQDVVSFVSDIETWTRWAPWIRSVTRLSRREWSLETAAGPMAVRFVEVNSLGVLDHEVTLESGVTVLNAMRVLPNGSGSELVMVIFQSPGVAAEEFARDVQAVADDLARLKEAAEALRVTTGRD